MYEFWCGVILRDVGNKFRQDRLLDKRGYERLIMVKKWSTRVQFEVGLC